MPHRPKGNADERAVERGSALVMAVFVLVLLAGMGVSLLSLSQIEVKMSQTSLNVKKAFYLAEAGQEDGRATLFEINGAEDFSDDLADGVGGGAAGPNGVINFDIANLLVNRDTSGNVTGLAGYGDDIPLRALTSFGDGWYAAFLTNDPVDGLANTVDSNDLVMLTGVGMGPNRSIEVVHAIIDRDALLPPPPPAAITLLGPTPHFESGTSNKSLYSGDDCGVPGGIIAPVLGTIGAEAEESAEDGIYKTEKTEAKEKDATEKVSSGPEMISGSNAYYDSFADITDSSHPMVVDSGLGTIDPEWTECELLHDMVEDLRAQADWTCSAEKSGCDIPTGMAPDSIFFLSGQDVSLNDTDTGRGILVVTGELSLSGRIGWEGKLMIIGRGSILRSGAGNGNISGGVVVADIAGPDDVYGTYDDCTGGPDNDGFDIGSYVVTGGGNGNIEFCSATLATADPPQPYDIIAFRQR